MYCKLRWSRGGNPGRSKAVWDSTSPRSQTARSRGHTASADGFPGSHSVQYVQKLSWMHGLCQNREFVALLCRAFQKRTCRNCSGEQEYAALRMDSFELDTQLDAVQQRH